MPLSVTKFKNKYLLDITVAVGIADPTVYYSFFILNITLLFLLESRVGFALLILL